MNLATIGLCIGLMMTPIHLPVSVVDYKFESATEYVIKPVPVPKPVPKEEPTPKPALKPVTPEKPASKPVQREKQVDKPAPAPVTKNGVTAGEADLMARLVTAEAKGEPYAGKVAVASVIMNRVDSGQFPNSIEGVVYQSGQFSPVTNGTINQPATGAAKKAVNEAVGGDRNTSALFFYNANIVKQSWLETRPTVTVIGNHTFKK